MVVELTSRDGFQGRVVGLPLEAVFRVGEYGDEKSAYSGSIIGDTLHVTHFSNPKEGYKHENRTELSGDFV